MQFNWWNSCSNFTTIFIQYLLKQNLFINKKKMLFYSSFSLLYNYPKKISNSFHSETLFLCVWRLSCHDLNSFSNPINARKTEFTDKFYFFFFSFRRCKHCGDFSFLRKGKFFFGKTCLQVRLLITFDIGIFVFKNIYFLS